MSLPAFVSDTSSDQIDVLWDDGDRIFCGRWRDGPGDARHRVLAVLPAARRPASVSLEHLAHEYRLKDVLDSAWAMKPLDLLHEHGRTTLVLEYAEGEPLHRLVGQPMEIGRFLRLAVAISAALGQLHERGLIHKDIKPSNLLVDSAGNVRLTGFGIASRLAARAPVA